MNVAPKKIIAFRGKYFFLSNFYTDSFGICVEKYYQASKTDDSVLRQKIFDAATPQKAKDLARGLPRKEDAKEIMGKLERFKFLSMPERRMLLETGGAELVEGNVWHDTFWGVCNCPQHKGEGENWLGKILMEVREELKEVFNRDGTPKKKDEGAGGFK